MTGRDPKSIIDDGAMRVGQWLAVLVTVGLNALDGFDVLSISFASPGIAKDWGIDKATLGWVLSMELFGMAFGSVLLGGVADKIGRRPTILGCLVAMAIGMFGAGHAHDVADAARLAAADRLRHRRHAGLDQCHRRGALQPALAQRRTGADGDRLSARRRRRRPVRAEAAGERHLARRVHCRCAGRRPPSCPSCGCWCPNRWRSSTGAAGPARSSRSIASWRASVTRRRVCSAGRARPPRGARSRTY